MASLHNLIKKKHAKIAKVTFRNNGVQNTTVTKSAEKYTKRVKRGLIIMQNGPEEDYGFIVNYL